MKAKLLGVAACAFLLFLSQPASSATMTFYFAGGVTSVNADNCVNPCDPSLIGPGSAAIGTRFSAQYTFDTAWTADFSNSTEAQYQSSLNSSPYTASVTLGGVDFLFSGMELEVSQHDANAHYSVAGNSVANGPSFAGGQQLAFGAWTLSLHSALSIPWGDGTTNIPGSPPELSNFLVRTFHLQAYSSHFLVNGLDVGHQYHGFVDYLGTSPTPAPIPPALLLFGSVLGLGGLLGWRSKRVLHSRPDLASTIDCTEDAENSAVNLKR
jgi:hypothetical protein